jgi:hydroxymethylpyrimidine pyrophosphatase-like HAD family hydrolase
MELIAVSGDCYKLKTERISLLLETVKLNGKFYKFFKDYKKDIKDSIKDLRIIYTDLDGTFFNDRGCAIKDAEGRYYFDAVRILPLIQQKGIDLVLASGRDKYQLRYNAQMIGARNYISELGAELVYDLGKTVHVTFDDKKYIYDLTYGGKDIIEIIEILMKEFPGKIEGRSEWSKYRAYNGLFFGEINLKKANNILRSKGYSELVLVDNGFSKLMNIELDVGRLHIYNLMPEGVTKANGIVLDKKIRNIKSENCIALGDSIEDIKMASEVKFFFLMKNALEHKDELEEELIKHDNVYITENLMNRGWSEIMESIL